jgi:hypothetical protein
VVSGIIMATTVPTKEQRIFPLHENYIDWLFPLFTDFGVLPVVDVGGSSSRSCPTLSIKSKPCDEGPFTHITHIPLQDRDDPSLPAQVFVH